MAARVAAFSVSVENGSFRLKGNGIGVDEGERELFEEMTAFPFGEPSLGERIDHVCRVGNDGDA